jgi:acyl-CoA synthetase (AMP-forming)/AMP-acid ligase II/acyl carrier protein
MRGDSGSGTRPAVPFSCLPLLLEHHAQRIPEAPAILAPGRSPLTYGGLYEHIEHTSQTLRSLGIGRHDRVAVVLPNGPEMAVTILAVAATATCAPMNPAYQVAEFDRYFDTLRPGAILLQAGIDSAARRIGLMRRIPIIELSPTAHAEAGLFTLAGDRKDARVQEPAKPDDIGILLLTSGTTADPKIVPQTHANICASAFSSAAAWALTDADRCINMLPLFHGHGLHNTLMASLAAGASVVCTSGWDIERFFKWLSEFRPTWYSAVSAIHQAVLREAPHCQRRVAECRLRFVRSGSAPLPAAILMQLETTFEAPVIEYYAMTETTSTPIASNPLPPARRKIGSPGVPVSLDVAIMDEDGILLTNGARGEIVVRGAGVMPGYYCDPMSTKAAFAGKWFKTGDMGYFDEEGYLFLTGRVREVINRGGEKITPQEVDEVLLQHPAVAEAVSFPIPHRTLGQDVASAVVLHPHAIATPGQIRQFAIGRLADFKIPRQVLIVDKIPKGPTGKLQRIGLADKLRIGEAPSPRRPFVPPRTPVQKVLSDHWAEILQLERVGTDDDFFGCGGDSLLAIHVLAHIRQFTGVELGISRFFEAPTVSEVARYVEAVLEAGQPPARISAITRAPRRNGAMPASIAQERFWKVQQALPDIPFFNVLYALRIRSPCHPDILEQSLNEIVRRHEILRTRFALRNGRCVQIIAPQQISPMSFHNLTDLRAGPKKRAAEEIVRQELLHPFDLAKGPLIRVRLLRLSCRRHLLLISMHQAVCDGWSLGVLIGELIALYDAFHAGVKSSLSPLPIQYADFAHWQRQWHSHADILAQLAYWREQLRGPLPPMTIGRYAPKRPIDELRTARLGWALPAKVTESAKRFAQTEGDTLFMVLVAALQTLLHRYLGHDDIRIATNVANRNRAGTAGLIGPVANTVILRTNLAGDPTARELLHRVRATTLAAFAHQDLRLEIIADALEKDCSANPEALANIMILLQNATLRPVTAAGHKLAIEEANPGMMLPLVTPTNFDVILMLHDGADGLRGTCVYRPHVFDLAAIERLLLDYAQVLEGLIHSPNRPISAIRISEHQEMVCA